MKDWTGTADAYARSFARLCAGAVPAILERTPVPGTALDAGTGTGTVAAALAQAGHNVEGVDAAADMVGHARAAHPGVRFTARTPEGLCALLAEGGLVDAAAAEISWDFVIPADDLWLGVEAGIATIGAIYRAQGEAGRAAMRGAFDELSGGGILTLPSTAVVAAATRP
jgi:SAM-dependent methyltransferase